MNILWITQLPNATADHMHYGHLEYLSQHINGKLIVVVHPNYNGRLTDLPIQIERFHSKGKLHIPSIIRIRQLITDYKIDIVMALDSRTLANTLLATLGLVISPKICGRYGIISPLHPWRIENYLTFLNPRIAHVFCVSEAARQAVIKSVPQQKTSVLYPYIEREFSSKYSRCEIFSQFNIPPESFAIVCVANFRPVKGVDIFLKTTFFLADYSDIHWIYIGADDRSLDTDVNPAVRHRVHRLGFQFQAMQLVQHCDAFVLASRSEGMGRALLEAMSLGICPIVARVGGMPEAVIDGKSGLLFEKEDVEGLSKAIIRIYKDSNLRHSLGQGALQKIQETFSLNKFSAHIMNIFVGLDK